MELKDEHLEQMGIPLGHKLKIVKKIKDLVKTIIKIIGHKIFIILQMQLEL